MKSKKRIIQPLQTCIYIILILLAVVYIAPMLWVLLVSLKTNAEVMGSPFSLPEIYQWGNYTFAWENARMGRAFLNSVLVSGITMIVSMLLGSMVAFAIARMRWKFSGLTLIYFLSGMMIPVHCVLIPLFVRFSKLGLTNSLTGLLLPYITFSLPTAVFLLTNFFKGMPSELMEAAFIDGCSIYKCFFSDCIATGKDWHHGCRIDEFCWELERIAYRTCVCDRRCEKDIAGHPDLFCKSLCNELCTNVCGNYDCDITDNTGILSLQQSDRRRTDCRRSEGMKS